MSYLEMVMDAQLMSALIKYEREYMFHPVRKWRFDFAFVEAMVALEIQGGTYTQGRHNRGVAMEGEYEKINEAAVLGWRVMFATAKMVMNGRALEYVQCALS